MLGIPYGYDRNAGRCTFGKPLVSNILPDLIHENRSAQVRERAPHRERRDEFAETALRISNQTPLSHATNRRTFRDICESGFLLSKKYLIEHKGVERQLDSAESFLGTEG